MPCLNVVQIVASVVLTGQTSNLNQTVYAFSSDSIVRVTLGSKWNNSPGEGTNWTFTLTTTDMLGNVSSLSTSTSGGFKGNTLVDEIVWVGSGTNAVLTSSSSGTVYPADVDVVIEQLA